MTPRALTHPHILDHVYIPTLCLHTWHLTNSLRILRFITLTNSDVNQLSKKKLWHHPIVLHYMFNVARQYPALLLYMFWKAGDTESRRVYLETAPYLTFSFIVLLKAKHSSEQLVGLITVMLTVNIRCVRLACQLTSQQYCSLILNQHQQPATSQSAVLFSHNKSASAINHSQTNTAIDISHLPHQPCLANRWRMAGHAWSGPCLVSSVAQVAQTLINN